MSGFVKAAAAVGVEETRDCEGAEGNNVARLGFTCGTHPCIFFLLDARMHEYIPSWYHYRTIRGSAHPPSFFSLTQYWMRMVIIVDL